MSSLARALLCAIGLLDCEDVQGFVREMAGRLIGANC